MRTLDIRQHQASEEVRQVLIHYRSLFEEFMKTESVVVEEVTK
jgi:hypothetical protein